MSIINLTMHLGTPEQGVIEPENKEEIKKLLLFKTLPSKLEMIDRTEALSIIASCYTHAMIGGAPFLMAPLVEALKNKGIVPLFAFSERVSEEKEVDGKIVKTNVFKHLGFVEG